MFEEEKYSNVTKYLNLGFNLVYKGISYGYPKFNI